MFIVGILVGPALAILAGDVLLTPGQVRPRWVLLALAALMLVIGVVPFFATELKIGLILGMPLGLLLASSPMEIHPADPVS